MNTKDIAEKIARSILMMQRRFALTMNKAMARCGQKAIKIMFSIFCVLMIIMSIAVTWNSLNCGKLQPVLRMSHLHIIKPVTAKTIEPVIVTAETYQRFWDFGRWLDSLSTNNRNRYDSVLSARPGLTDSILILKRIYLSRQKSLYEN